MHNDSPAAPASLPQYKPQPVAPRTRMKIDASLRDIESIAPQVSPIIPFPRDHVPLAYAVRELVGLPATRSDPYLAGGSYRPLPGRMENGVRVITYSMEAPAMPEYEAFGVTVLEPVTRDDQHEAIAKAMEEFEKVANIRFERLPAERSQQADIKIFSTPQEMAYNTLGYAKVADGSPTHIAINQNQFTGSFGHELAHAMGLSHPGKDGEHPNYSKNSTLMSYVPGRLREYESLLGPYDIAALQYHYGKPKDMSPDRLFKVTRTPSTIYSETPVSLDYRNSSQPAYHLHMPPTDSKEGKNGIRYHDRNRLAFGTNIADAIFTGNPFPVSIQGNALPNMLFGGCNNNSRYNVSNVLESVGSGDTLVGDVRARKTQFILNKNSMDTTISQFTPGRDEITLPHRTATVELVEEKRRGYSPGTTILAYDTSGKPVASAFVPGVAMEELAKLANHVNVTTSSRKDPSPFKRTLIPRAVDVAENEPPLPTPVIGSLAEQKQR